MDKNNYIFTNRSTLMDKKDKKNNIVTFKNYTLTNDINNSQPLDNQQNLPPIPPIPSIPPIPPNNSVVQTLPYDDRDNILDKKTNLTIKRKPTGPLKGGKLKNKRKNKYIKRTTKRKYRKIRSRNNS